MTGSRGPESNPNARRRNLPRVAKVQLPAEGYQGEIPPWPMTEFTMPEIGRWEQLWRTAQAAQWARMHIELTVALYVRVSLAVENEAKNNVATAQTLNSMTAMQDRLGLNPQSLKRLEWEIVADELEEVRKPTRTRRTLRAVDPEASSG